MSSRSNAGRWRWALVLGAVLSLTGCFQDQVMGPGADPTGEEGSTTGELGTGESESDAGPASTGSELDGPGSTGQEGSTGMADESTGGFGSTGGDDEDSTGEQVDGSTGEEILGIDELLPGDLVVTEVMWNPNCSLDSCEWIEILNTTDLPVNLADLYIQDIDYNAGNQGRVTLDVIVPPGQLAVITRGVSFWPYDFEPDAIYGPNPGLNNGSPDRVVLRSETEIIDETASFSIDQEEGVAWSLSAGSLDATSNDSSSHWCDATVELPTLTTTEYGTPGVLNPSC